MLRKLTRLANEYQALAILCGALSTVAIIVVGLFTTFMTISAGEKLEASTKQYVDQKIGGVEASLGDMSRTLERIDERVYEIHKERGAHGRKNGD